MTLGLGSLYTTPGALRALEEAEERAFDYFARHEAGDWGTVDAEDWSTNDDAIRDDCRVLSAYILSTGVKIWVITEADRSMTTVLLPEEY